MGEAQQGQPLPLPIFGGQEAMEEGIMSPKTPMIHHQPPPPPARYKWWLRITIFTLFFLSGQATATLLLRLYFDKGGNSQWLATLVQIGGFPILIPLMFLYPTKKENAAKPSQSILVYLLLGIILAANSSLFTLGVSNLPVSTFSLISASQLAFNALFSYFLNAQKFTPLIINSLVLLTVSSTLLVFHNDHDQQQQSSTTSKNKYAVGFVCTVGGAASSGLLFSSTQFAFRKILKLTTLRVVIDLIIYQSFVATILILIALFVSKEWKTLKGEMEGYKLGRASYVITLVGAGMSMQIYAMGMIGLIFEVSSLFSNVIGALGLPIVPIFAAVFFHDKMSGVKVVAMFLAIWGFSSYIYQEYLDDSKSKTEANDVNEVSLTERV